MRMSVKLGNMLMRALTRPEPQCGQRGRTDTGLGISVIVLS
jgi:hypothetical protein